MDEFECLRLILSKRTLERHRTLSRRRSALQQQLVLVVSDNWILKDKHGFIFFSEHKWPVTNRKLLSLTWLYDHRVRLKFDEIICQRELVALDLDFNIGRVFKCHVLRSDFTNRADQLNLFNILGFVYRNDEVVEHVFAAFLDHECKSELVNSSLQR